MTEHYRKIMEAGSRLDFWQIYGTQILGMQKGESLRTYLTNDFARKFSVEAAMQFIKAHHVTHTNEYLIQIDTDANGHIFFTIQRTQ